MVNAFSVEMMATREDTEVVATVEIDQANATDMDS